MTSKPNEIEKNSFRKGVRNFLSGAGAGVVSTVLCSPLDVVKIRMQVQGSVTLKFRGIISWLYISLIVYFERQHRNYKVHWNCTCIEDDIQGRKTIRIVQRTGERYRKSVLSPVVSLTTIHVNWFFIGSRTIDWLALNSGWRFAQFIKYLFLSQFLYSGQFTFIPVSSWKIFYTHHYTNYFDANFRWTPQGRIPSKGIFSNIISYILSSHWRRHRRCTFMPPLINNSLKYDDV